MFGEGCVIYCATINLNYMLKYTLLAACALLMYMPLYAQNYTLLHNDHADVTNPAFLDIKTVSYRLDRSKDSIWFKVEMHNQASGSNVNITIPIDANSDVTDGEDWWKRNKSMKYDRILFVFSHDNTPSTYNSYYREGAGNFVNNPATTFCPDAHTYIVRVALSLFDADGRFNFIVATGNYDTPQDKHIYDEAPDNSYLSTIDFPTGVGGAETALQASLQPNPAKGSVQLKLDAGQLKQATVSIVNVLGVVVLSQPIQQASTWLALDGIAAGNYTVVVRNGQQRQAMPLVVQ
jgi:hypothetical protein